jgi:VWFA-related protein
MRKILLVSLLALMTGGGLVAQGPSAGPTFTSTVDVVPISAVVRDSRGRLVTTLQAPDFEVLDNGEASRLIDFQTDHTSTLTLAVLVDTSGSMRIGPKLAFARDSLARFTRTLHDGRDEVGLFTFDATLHEQLPFSVNFAGIGAMLGGTDPFGTTSLYDAIAETARRLARQPGSRRAIVVITDGADTSSTLTPPEVSALASSIDVPVYVIATVLPIDRPVDLVANGSRKAPQDDLQELARWTGGNLLWVSNDEEATLGTDQIVTELRQQYMIVIESSHERGWRPLDVRARDPRLIVHARSGYFAHD